MLNPATRNPCQQPKSFQKMDLKRASHAEQIAPRKIRAMKMETTLTTLSNSKANRQKEHQSQLVTPRKKIRRISPRREMKTKKKRRMAQDVVAVAGAVGAGEEARAKSPEKKARPREERPNPPLRTRSLLPSSSKRRPMSGPNHANSLPEKVEIAEAATAVAAIKSRAKKKELAERRGKEHALPAREMEEHAHPVRAETDAAAVETTDVAAMVEAMERTDVVAETNVATEALIEEEEEVAAVETEHRVTSLNSNSSSRNKKRKANLKRIDRLSYF